VFAVFGRKKVHPFLCGGRKFSDACVQKKKRRRKVFRPARGQPRGRKEPAFQSLGKTTKKK